ncbi:hypothetical protein CBM2626_B130121 [Cupriavidus taiwanensis]|uniref:Uncharacterized protein n=1 Tax=Cupriavidus taiwanensis TaxID=164546 RepID=A0A976G4C6_9BURK|nr:hypothetical protein CBM2614_B200015 [Cupriavidus taiwanensis]SOZ67012.1 hypothetical protein CBM2615_B190016 [Cupriavidus taiwanensis]SOZ70363.1 hypothetical protein CBM2613_B160015 [Cupriavidus taiwanensis]SPA01932.1 hypothetical protein CBM2626_B130121 [Cupriavidus taiwanensis]SPA08693.1 hypothetical protein CBM2625_B170015 [Cupriavidus taiwanensis]
MQHLWGAATESRQPPEGKKPNGGD